jgi:nuclear pore complex protein Nup155
MTISRALVNVVIDQQIGQQISVRFPVQPLLSTFSFILKITYFPQVDTISEILQHRCGSFCSTDDVMLYKVCNLLTADFIFSLSWRQAKENIRKAAETRNPTERQRHLAEALRFMFLVCIYRAQLISSHRLFSKGARVLEFEKLREVIGDFQQLNYAKGKLSHRFISSFLPVRCGD